MLWISFLSFGPVLIAAIVGVLLAIRERTIATLSVGYADGLRRALSNRGSAIVRGRVAPIAGIVTMDMTMVDVTDKRCAVGDVVTLIGRDGDATITVADVAAAGGFSPYEILTGLRGRLPRVYVGKGDA